MKRALTIAFIAAGAALTVLPLMSMAMAQAVAAAPPAPDTVTIPLGDWIGTLIGDVTSVPANYPGTIIAAVVAWLFRKLPSQLQGVLLTFRANQLVERSITYALNTVAGATADKRLSIQVASPVVAQALNFGVQQGAQSVIQFVGGREGLARMVWSRLDLVPEATKSDLTRIIAAHVDPPSGR